MKRSEKNDSSVWNAPHPVTRTNKGFAGVTIFSFCEWKMSRYSIYSAALTSGGGTISKSKKPRMIISR